MLRWLQSPDALPAIQTEQARRDFGLWLGQVTPTWSWDWPHLRYIREHLRRVTEGEIDRLMLFLPPRHGKSEMVTVRYSVWMLERDPSTRVVIAAYNQTLANKFSRKARRIARERITLDDERSATDDWQTEQGGGVRAVGVGAGITGQGGNLIVIDDPVKSREEANSEAYRRRCWDWYTDDLTTRLEPGAPMILIMTRWHEDDLAGRILESTAADNWTVVSLPAIAEEADPLGREVGEALCPDRYGLDVLEERRKVLGNSFHALYQQRPAPPEGSMFRRGWFEIVPAYPVDGMSWVRYWDKAATAGAGAFTAGVLVGRHRTGTYYITDVVRGQWAAAEREREIKSTAYLDRQIYGRVLTYVEQEPGSGGKDSAEATVRNLGGFPVYADRPTGKKETRAEPVSAQAMVGNVKIVAGDWNAAYIDELLTFPFGKFKDQVDATSGGFAKLLERGATGFARY